MKLMLTILLTVAGLYFTVEFFWIHSQAKSVMHQQYAATYMLIAVILFVFAFLVNRLLPADTGNSDIFGKIQKHVAGQVEKQKTKNKNSNDTKKAAFDWNQAAGDTIILVVLLVLGTGIVAIGLLAQY